MYLLRGILLFLLPLSVAWANIPSPEIARYQQSWIAQTLKFQRQLDIHSPLNQATFIGTHNSENSVAYQIPFVRYVDPNQQISIYDQLNVGVRSIEFDVHWYTDTHFSKDVLLCHGLSNHLGCSVFDRPVNEGLAELKAWLDSNPGEVVILYFDRTLDGHEPRLTAYLNQQLEKYIYKPVQENNQHQCKSLDTHLTKADILNAGKQLLIITKGCDTAPYEEQNRFPFFWNDYVYAGVGQTNNNRYNMLDSSYDDDFKSYPTCAKQSVFVDDPTHENVWRIFEDRTILSSLGKPKRKLLVSDVKDLMRCAVNWPTLDMLTLNDERLGALVWTWAQDYPQQELGHCVYAENNTGMKNTNCESNISSYACKDSQTQSFKVLNRSGPWQAGESFCQSLGTTWHFVMPMNASEMNRIYELITTDHKVWLNYRI